MTENQQQRAKRVSVLFRDKTRLIFEHHIEYENQPNFSNNVHVEDGFLCITDQVNTITMYPRDVILEVKVEDCYDL